jgi:hypothetical protein
MPLDLNKLGAAAAKQNDLTQSQSFERQVAAEGVTLLRFRDYIEIGRHKPGNPNHKPALQALLTFELHGVKHLIEIDGKKVPMTHQIKLSMGLTEKSGFRKLFKLMNNAHGGEAQHFVQLIGKPFLGEIFHNVVGEGDKKQVFANLDQDGAYSIKAPVQVDAVSGDSTPINVPEMHGTPKVFLWETDDVSDEDIQEMWKDIFIEGTRTVKENGQDVEKSKNWIQETIQKNLEWEGSRTQSLTEEQVSLDALAGSAEAAQVPEEGEVPTL